MKEDSWVRLLLIPGLIGFLVPFVLAPLIHDTTVRLIISLPLIVLLITVIHLAERVKRNEEIKKENKTKKKSH